MPKKKTTIKEQDDPWVHKGDLQSLKNKYLDLERSTRKHWPFYFALIDIEKVCSVCRANDLSDKDAVKMMFNLNVAFQAPIIQKEDGTDGRIDAYIKFKHQSGI